MGGLLSLTAFSGAITPTKSMLGYGTIIGIIEQNKPRKEDFKLTCKQINKRIGNLQSIFDELDKADQERKKKNALKESAISAGLGIVRAKLGFDHAMNGSVDDVNVVNADTAIADKVLSSESDAEDIKSITAKQPIAYRLIALNRVKNEKCTEL